MKNAEQIAFERDVGATGRAQCTESNAGATGRAGNGHAALSADTRQSMLRLRQPSSSLAQRIGPGGTVTGIDISHPCWHWLEAGHQNCTTALRPPRGRC